MSYVNHSGVPLFSPLCPLFVSRTLQVTNYSMQRRSPPIRRWWTSKSSQPIFFFLLNILLDCQDYITTSSLLCVCLSFVCSYYKGIRQMVPVSDQDMNTHLAEVSRVRGTAGISSPTLLFKLKSLKMSALADLSDIGV